MADIQISPDEIRDALKDFVSKYEPAKAETTEVGHVLDASDGIAHVEGLPGVMANELIRFADGTLGLAQNLDENEVGVVVLGEFDDIVEGMEVTRTGEVLSVPVGDGYLGRVVDPLGNPIDGLGEIATEGRRELELQAPGVMQRKSVHEPLQTGIKAIDAMIPRPARRPSRSTRSSTRRPTGSRATSTSRSAASTSPSARRARPSPR